MLFKSLSLGIKKVDLAENAKKEVLYLVKNKIAGCKHNYIAHTYVCTKATHVHREYLSLPSIFRQFYRRNIRDVRLTW